MHRHVAIKQEYTQWRSEWRRARDLGPLQVEGLGVVTEQHYILLQVSHTPVFMAPHTILLTEKHLWAKTAPLPLIPPRSLGAFGLGDNLRYKMPFTFI